MKELVIRVESGIAMLAEIEVKKQEEELRTAYVSRERVATPKEILLYHSGYGRLLVFEQ